ncbi:GAF and ANTAR domain-containing protein [Streptomonospora sp. PA3]|uniref:GAF and ANTAR domain-containing protein n=1 Tax=Streptomonospora sp. PA3 TaxID=2607326 RepID=UPI001CA3E9FB|nr:GAF and ANTAR domain-containing protein [Streptomonospora sp. PA3]
MASTIGSGDADGIETDGIEIGGIEQPSVDTALVGADDRALAKAFAEYARDLLAQDTVQSTLEEITALAVSEIEGCEHAGVSLVERKKHISTHAATSPLVHQVDEIQYSTGEGPCLQAIWVREVFSIDSFEEETRWPRFTARAFPLGVQSMCSFQLFTHDDILGGLNLYSSKPRAFGVEAYEIGQILAAHAAVALANAQTQYNLKRAVRTRQRIGEATGILIERYRITDRQAFSLLAKASQNLNVKLSALADELVETGSFPDGG